MLDPVPAPSPPGRFLSMLSHTEFAAIAPLLTPIHCDAKQILGHRGGLIDFVYFPTGAVLSVLSLMRAGQAVEVGTIGDEGFHGIDALIGATHWSDLSLCQVSGPALRMSIADFHSAVVPGAPLNRIAYAYLRAYLASVSQSVACNRLHSIEERFARWVLMTHDRVHSDEFDLTQEFLADMLGVHRPQISLVAGAFQQAGFLKYHRGHMAIVNRDGLEQSACECYALGRQQIETMLGTKDLSAM